MPSPPSPSTATVASELVELCRAGKNLEAIDRLYSPNILSIEPVGDKQMPAELHGVDAIRVKNEWWFANHDIHRAEVNGPFLGEDQFAVQYTRGTGGVFSISVLIHTGEAEAGRGPGGGR